MDELKWATGGGGSSTLLALTHLQHSAKDAFETLSDRDARDRHDRALAVADAERLAARQRFRRTWRKRTKKVTPTALSRPARTIRPPPSLPPPIDAGLGVARHPQECGTGVAVGVLHVAPSAGGAAQRRRLARTPDAAVSRQTHPHLTEGGGGEGERLGGGEGGSAGGGVDGGGGGGGGIAEERQGGADGGSAGGDLDVGVGGGGGIAGNAADGGGSHDRGIARRDDAHRDDDRPSENANGKRRDPKQRRHVQPHRSTFPLTDSPMDPHAPPFGARRLAMMMVVAVFSTMLSAQPLWTGSCARAHTHAGAGAGVGEHRRSSSRARGGGLAAPVLAAAALTTSLLPGAQAKFTFSVGRRQPPPSQLPNSPQTQRPTLGNGDGDDESDDDEEPTITTPDGPSYTATDPSSTSNGARVGGGLERGSSGAPSQGTVVPFGYPSNAGTNGTGERAGERGGGASGAGQSQQGMDLPSSATDPQSAWKYAGQVTLDYLGDSVRSFRKGWSARTGFSGFFSGKYGGWIERVAGGVSVGASAWPSPTPNSPLRQATDVR